MTLNSVTHVQPSTIWSAVIALAAILVVVVMAATILNGQNPQLFDITIDPADPLWHW